MWPNASDHFFNQYWAYAFFSQYWPYAALAAAAVVLVLLWKTWKSVRSVEAQVNRLRADLRQMQIAESRRLLAEINSPRIAVIQTNGSSDDPSIIPTATPTNAST